MTGVKNIMTAMKTAVSPNPRRADAPTASLIALPLVSRTPLTDFICSRLEGETLQLFGLLFAEAIKNDRHAQIILFENVYKFLGYDRYDVAVKQLKRLFPSIESGNANHHFKVEITKCAPGRSKDPYLISARQFEKLLVEAKTGEGALARDMMLELKDAVQDYIKMEMEEASRLAQQQLEESHAQRLELQAIQAKLQATIESQKKRDEKKEARKRQQKEPMETVYIMTNMPDDNQGPYKCGKTGGDVKKRAKDMQTGNHEDMRVVANVKCVDSKLVEDVMHRIFHDYRTNDKLEWFDAPLDSMKSVMRFVVETIDGLNRVDHDEVSISEHLEQMTASMREHVLHLPAHSDSWSRKEDAASQMGGQDSDPYAGFWTECMIPHGDPWKTISKTTMKDAFRRWIKRRCLDMPSSHLLTLYLDHRMAFKDTSRIVNNKKVNVYGYVEWSLKSELVDN